MVFRIVEKSARLPLVVGLHDNDDDVVFACVSQPPTTHRPPQNNYSKIMWLIQVVRHVPHFTTLCVHAVVIAPDIFMGAMAVL